MSFGPAFSPAFQKTSPILRYVYSIAAKVAARFNALLNLYETDNDAATLGARYRAGLKVDQGQQ